MGNKTVIMRKIRSALISLSDKSNLKPLLKELRRNNIKIISSGGTFKAIKKLKFKCLDVSDFTGFKEILNGRVKTLHPKIHAGILNKRSNKSHSSDIKKNNYNFKFDIRFHLEPNIKLMKTQDNKSILIELEDEGWKFTCDNYEINIDNGLYFGNKNSYIENQNIFVSGILNNNEENIKWEIKKI